MNDLAHMTLEHLKALRAGQDRLEAQLRELTARISGVEHQLVSIHGGIAGMQARQDRNDGSLRRIENRLELLPQ